MLHQLLTDIMQDKQKVAIFDFCETLVNFQTADAFVNYVRERTKSEKMKVKNTIGIILRKARIIPILSLIFKRSSLNKRVILWQLRGFDIDQLNQFAEDYYEDIIRPNFIKPVVNELKSLKNKGWRIVIASGGYEIYLKYFCSDFNISLKDLIAVRIGFSNKKCSGTFDGGDRLWDKVEQLESRFDRNVVSSVAYSDSITDLPMLQWADEGIVVRREDKESWSRIYKFKEIVWSQE